MKDLQSKEKFIQLRAQGLSFDKISKEIGVSKPTLIKWNQEASKEVANLFYFYSEGIIEKYKLLKAQRLEALACTLNKALEELEKRNFENIATKDLISIVFSLEKRIKDELINVQCFTGITESPFALDSETFKEKTFPIVY